MGMGQALSAADGRITKLYERANEIVGYDLTSVCFEGPAERLDSTEISQPAIFVTSVACLEALRSGEQYAELAEAGFQACAGLSLGEYTALYAAGAMSFEDGLRLVQTRGWCMQEAAKEYAGAMVSVLGLDAEGAERLCERVLGEGAREDGGGKAVLAAVNFNCPGQIVLSGTVRACQRAEELASEFGATRTVALRVAGAFHTELMSSAAARLGEALGKCEFAKPNCAVIANVDGQVYDGVDQISDKLLRQLVSPVRWQQCVEHLLAEGFERFVEIGPGRVLTGLGKKICRAQGKKVEFLKVGD